MNEEEKTKLANGINGIVDQLSKWVNSNPHRKLLSRIGKDIAADQEKLKKEIESIQAHWKLVADDPLTYAPICDDTTKYRLERIRTNTQRFYELLNISERKQ